MADDAKISVLEQLRHWPPKDQVALAADLLRRFRPSSQIGPRKTLPAALRIGERRKGPPPDDETVARWIQEWRMEKYG